MNSFLEPFKESWIIKLILALLIFLKSLFSFGQVDEKSNLYQTLKAKDSIIFERSFNKCEIKQLHNIIADNFEFYHDVAGFETRDAFLKSIKNNICSTPGNMKRELVDNSLKVYPLKNNGVIYGAIQKGKHTFQEKQNGVLTTTGIADFTHLWILEDNKWKLKRVLSYNHKPYSI